MIYDKGKREIVLNRELNNLDRLALKFTKIIKKYVDYVIVSGYVSILLGRARTTEDIDLFIKRIEKEKFGKMYGELKENGFWCINAESLNEIYSYINDGLAVRFARNNTSIPNFEAKFPKNKIDSESFNDSITVNLKGGFLIISSLERQIAFKRYYLKSEKDEEDALHIEEIFKEHIDYEKIRELKEEIERKER